MVERQTRDDERKLAVLRSLALEAFDELDRGQGIVVEDAARLGEFIRRIGYRAGETASHDATHP